MKIVVITGSTRGIGYGLAESFLERGCAVTISGRSTSVVDEAVARLAIKYNVENIYGVSCDVRDIEQVETLWGKTKEHFGKVDFWINNAGIGSPPLKFWEHQAEVIQAVVNINLTGLMNGCSVAIKGMIKQGFGFVYNMEGLGSDGRQVEGTILYGSTKYAVSYLTKGLVKELKDSPVNVGFLSPGMVITDLLTGGYDKRSTDWERAKQIFNILADRTEVVTPWLVESRLRNTRNGAQIRWLSTPKIIGRFLRSPFFKRDLFKEKFTTK